MTQEMQSRIPQVHISFRHSLAERGVIKKKYIDVEGKHCVDIETSAINQSGEEVMPGNAAVVLTSREKKDRFWIEDY